MGKQQVIEFEINSGSVFLCDMRPGFTEDGVECALPSGKYGVALADSAENGGRGFSLVLDGESPDGRVSAGSVDVDGARIGIFNRKAFLDHFGGDFEDLFEWSDGEASPPMGGIVEISPEDNTLLKALVVDVQCDSRYQIEYLKSGAEKVGLAVTPIRPEITPGKARRFTRVDVKFIGIGEPWYYMDDWDYEPALEDVIESLILDQVLYCELVKGRHIKSEDVSPGAPLRQYVSKFRGVKRIGAFLEVDQNRAKRIPLPESLDVSKFSAETTFRELGDIVLSVLRYVRQRD
jgi:hypothetical protein